MMLGMYTDGRVAPRSGLAAKHGIDTMAGVIDADYRGQVGVLLANLSDEDFVINEGDRIAQLIIEKVGFKHLQTVLHRIDLTMTTDRHTRSRRCRFPTRVRSWCWRLR